jgi:hypothetical protein
MKRVLLLGLIGLALVGCGDNKSNKIPSECDSEATITGKSYPVLWESILYKKNGSEMIPIVNEKYKKMTGKTDYLSVDSSTSVVEECVNGEFSYIRLTSPDYLVETHKGWIKQSDLDKGQALENEYDRYISELVKVKYTPDNWDDLALLLGNEFEKVNSLRYSAAKFIIDSKKCKYVDDSSIDPFNYGTRDNLRFIVECRDGERIKIDEKTIYRGGVVKTDLEKAIPENLAIDKCNNLIKGKANKYGEIDLYSLTGTSYDVNKTNGNATVDVYFDVKNKFGNKESFKARCLFESESWNGEIVIKNR